MSVTTRPDAIVLKHETYESILTPVAFRAGKRHPWRSYEPGNPRYKRDFDQNIYALEMVNGVEVLCIRKDQIHGFYYEAHCCGCGAYVSGYIPFPNPVERVGDVRVTCAACLVHIEGPQDVARYYTPEYVAGLNRKEK